MGLYLGKDKISALRTIEKTVPSMKAYLEAGGKFGHSINTTTFEGCWQASDWENVTDFSYMFYNCEKLTSIPPMSIVNMTNTSYMFRYCESLISTPAMNTSNVTNMERMFSDCGSLTSVPAMDTSKVTNMRSMFSDCGSLTSVPAMDTSKVTNMRSMFSDCGSLTSVPAMDTSKVTEISSIFWYCSSLISIPAMDVSNVPNAYSIFDYCYNLESIHMHGMKFSFDIHWSKKLTREALVEILNNLATVTTSPTLTMGSTNLAKLTDADKAIATGKGWKLE